MILNELRDEVFDYAEKQGFHENNDFGRSLMLVVSELSEALEADRKGKWENGKIANSFPHGVAPEKLTAQFYEQHIRGTAEEEIADAITRLCDIAGVWGIDLDFHVRAKMAYNKTRPYKHGKKN